MSNLTSISSHTLPDDCRFFKKQNASGEFCDSVWDGLNCWPKTQKGTTSIIACFKELNGIMYDTTKSASRHCFDNGTWDRPDLTQCIPLLNYSKLDYEEIQETLKESNDAGSIFFFGYFFSVLGCILAFLIFTYVLPSQEAKCLRVRIHRSLIITYILTGIFWIILYFNQLPENGYCILFVVLNYFLTTSYFWMFVEGLNLFLLLKKPFDLDSKAYIYRIIGWFIPFALIMVWSLLKYYHNDKLFIFDDKPKWRFLRQSYLDMILIIPILIVLFSNVVFAIIIVFILCKKLKVPKMSQLSNSNDTSKDYWRSLKSILFLIPLLGLNYWFLLFPPDEKRARLIVLYFRSFLFSFQGLFVAIIFCFTNSEVKRALTDKINRYKDMRKLSLDSSKTKNRRFKDIESPALIEKTTQI